MGLSFVHSDHPDMETAVKWTAAQAVEYLFLITNVNEKYFANVTAADFLEDVGDANTPVNVKIPLGASLFQSLTLLVEPLGINWFVSFFAGPEIRFSRRENPLGTTIISYPAAGSSLTGPPAVEASIKVDHSFMRSCGQMYMQAVLS